MSGMGRNFSEVDQIEDHRLITSRKIPPFMPKN